MENQTRDQTLNLIKQVIDKATVKTKQVRFDSSFHTVLTSVPLSETAKYRIVVLGQKAWQHFMLSSLFYTFDFVGNHDELLQGKLGNTFGATFLTDVYLHPDEQLLADKDTFYIASTNGDVVIEAFSYVSQPSK